MSNQPQLPLVQTGTNTIVNVASVPLRSPFRYPGGKTWLVPTIRAWLTSRKSLPDVFVEPFAGGAIVGLTVAFEHLAKKVILAERDEGVSAVWRLLIDDNDGDWLARRIEAFDLTETNVLAVLAQEPSERRDVAFQTILRNRVSRGGIMAKGAGLIKFGESGKGLRSRWYPKTLARRIREIGQIRGRLVFGGAEGFAVLEEHLGNEQAALFLDPPYTAGESGKRAGLRLYNHSVIDHQRLFAAMARARSDFLMTYDNDEAVQRMAAEYGFEMLAVAMKSTHHTQMTELLINKDLSYVTRATVGAADTNAFAKADQW
jgi:DNA adenine methylase